MTPDSRNGLPDPKCFEPHAESVGNVGVGWEVGDRRLPDLEPRRTRSRATH